MPTTTFRNRSLLQDENANSEESTQDAECHVDNNNEDELAEVDNIDNAQQEKTISEDEEEQQTHLQFELVKRGLEIVECIFVAEPGNVENTSSGASSSASNISTAKYIHAVTHTGQPLFLVIDAQGMVTRTPYDTLLETCTVQDLRSDFVKESEECVKSTECSIVIRSNDFLCVYSKEADATYRRQPYRIVGGVVDGGERVGQAERKAEHVGQKVERQQQQQHLCSTARASRALPVIDASFLESSGSVRYFPILKLSFLLRDTKNALFTVDSVSRSILQFSVRLCSKKFSAFRHHLGCVQQLLDQYESDSNDFLHVTKKSLNYLQTASRQLSKKANSAAESDEKLRFNMRKRIEYLNDFVETRNNFYNEGLDILAYWSGALSHLDKTIRERTQRLEYILEPVRDSTNVDAVDDNEA